MALLVPKPVLAPKPAPEPNPVVVPAKRPPGLAAPPKRPPPAVLVAAPNPLPKPIEIGKEKGKFENTQKKKQ